MKKHFGIFINFIGSKSPLTEEVQRKLDECTTDWLRLAPGQYIVVSEFTPEIIYTSLKQVLHSNDLILVAEVNLTNRQGWLQPVAINWINNQSA